MQVIDLGTSFGIRVPPKQDPEVHVFQGKVAIERDNEPGRIEFGEDSAVRVTAEGLAPLTLSREGFPSSADFRFEEQSRDVERYSRWRSYADRLSADASVLLHYTFEDQSPEDIEVVNRSQASVRGSNGTIVGAPWSQGRWPMKGALRFQGENDRLLFKLPGAYDSLTFLVWLRVERTSADAFRDSADGKAAALDAQFLVATRRNGRRGQT